MAGPVAGVPGVTVAMPPTCVIGPDLLTLDECSALLAEARARRPDALRLDRPGWRVVDDRQFLGHAHYWYSLAGDVREEVHRRLAARANALVAATLHPVQSNYLYYGAGDSLGLHHDQARCPFTVIALLGGEAEPLCVHLELVATPPAELDRIEDPETHAGGTRMPLQDGPLLISGGVIPHHRPPHDGDREITIATFCFGVDRDR